MDGRFPFGGGFLCREIQGNRSFAFVYAVPEPGNSIEKLTCKGWMA